MEPTGTLLRRIAVAQVGPDPKGGGGMAAVLRGLFASSLAERYDLEMIVTYRSPRPLPRLGVFLSGLVRLVRWSLRRGPRLIHIHTAARGSLYRKAVFIFVGRLLSRPVLVHIHAGMGDIEAFANRLGPVRRLLLRRGLLASTRVLAVSAESARMTERCFDVEGILVVPNAAPPPTRSDLGDSKKADRVLFVGGFANPVKGGEVFVEALDALAPQLPEVPFVLAGPGDPPEALEARIAAHPNATWAGWLDEAAKSEQLAHCAVFVLPSLSEGLPVALLEAMAWGRAIVATRVGGIPEVVGDEVEALLVDSGDPAALAARVRQLLEDSEERRRLGKAARERAASLNEVEVCGRLDALYQEVLR
jgi:glycosyltransferase involved in cell wall biosynthesis